MTNDILETTSRFVAWRIISLDKIVGGSLCSKEFKMGKWCWDLEYYNQHEKIQLKLKPKDKQHLPYPPIVSFVFHVFCSKGSPIITTGEEYKNIEIPYGKRLPFATLDMSTLHATTPVIFSMEFLDLKMEDGNDGKIYSIWNAECSKQNAPDEPLGRMLLESIYTDIVINARDGSIEAHRAVLAANSSVFKTMFSKNYIEKETSIVNMNDMSIGACRAMLNFVYGIRGDNDLRVHIMELMIAADKYDIVELRKECAASLCKDVGAKNVFERLLCASRYDLPELKTTCLFFLVKMGMIFKLREDYNSFIREADSELIGLVSNAFLDAWEAT